MTSNICLIVCFYKGSRDGNQECDFLNYINTHKLSLNILQHNLSKIVFVISQDNIVHPKIIVEKNEKFNITYYYRKNKNLSFGGWVDAMKTFKHDYYILCEDDYIFTKNNFDKILLDTYIKNNSEYLVTWYQNNINKNYINYLNDRVGISTIGIMSKKYINLFINYNNYNYDFNKGNIMLNFLLKFKTISCLDKNNNLFPYWCHINQKICLFDDNYDIDYKNVISESENIDYDRILLACYQFVVKNKDKIFSISN